jgi:ABC-type multidrug transport system ATPase subunit
MSNGLTISLRSVSFEIAKGFSRGRLSLLSDINLEIVPGEFISILGPSGAGKSTLLHMMNGDYTPTAGEIELNGIEAREFLRQYRCSLAYLPQDPVLHEPLTPAVALAYSARLRGLGGGRHLAQAALEQVAMAERANTPIHNLSGGERKRVALAAELLGEPIALFLDEATSGLDPATEKEMMELFQRQSRAGRTVICITHFPDNVVICDKLAVVAKGRLVFHGTPAEVCAHFHIQSVGELYSKLDGGANDTEPIRPPVRAHTLSPIAQPMTINVAQSPGPVAQTAIQMARYARLLAPDARNMLLLLLQAPIIALFIGATFGNIAVDFSEQHAADLKQIAFLLIMAVLWCAGSNGVREIVKERRIFLHESRYGLNPVSYFLSKFIPLGAIGVMQSFLLLAILGRITHLAGDWSGHFVVLAVLGLAATGIGLCISAAVKTSERAMTFLPVILIALAVLSGGLGRITVGRKSPPTCLIPPFGHLKE